MKIRKYLWAIPALTWMVWAHAQAPDADHFVVGDIRVVGLGRVSEGTVFNYLSVNPGDEMTPARQRDALRELYKTGFFDDVKLYRDGSVLVVQVVERPTIDGFEITGNKDLKTEDLTTQLRGAGLASGKIFDRSVLEDVKSSLVDLYFSQGKYDVTIDAEVQEESDNLVSILITIDEGERARIRQIGIIGNTKFKEEDILKSFELKPRRWNNFWKKETRYSRESIRGDIEKLTTFYQNRGYADFEMESVVVTISPDKDDMFVTMSVREGDIYKISDVKIGGNTIIPAREMQALVLVRKGQIYSQQIISATQKSIEATLGNQGYAFAKVDPRPVLDKEKKEVEMTFLVDPGQRVYVRHIEFKGTERTQDVVLRREVRQLEGGWVSNYNLERSKDRIQALPYIENVSYEKTRVEGSDDLVDVTYTIKEGPSATLTGGLGYSGAESIFVTGNYADSNFLGSGNRISFDVNTGRYRRQASFSHSNDYIGIENISRTFSVTYSDVSQFVSASSDFSSKSFAGALRFGYPISEFASLQLGLNVTHSELITNSSGSAQQAQAWVQQNGKPYSYSAVDTFGNIYEYYGSKYTVYELTAGWYRDSYDRYLFPTRGQRQNLALTSSIPGSAVDYWTADYQFSQYVPIWRLTGNVSLQASYGAAFGKTTTLPPYRLFYAGGPDTVRGYQESRLGPKDNFGNPFGGNLLTVARAQLIFPLPAKFQTTARVSLFYDIGNAFSTEGTQFLGRNGQTPVTYKFKFANLRRSAGVAVEWLLPLGLFRFSYGVPLNASKGDFVRWPDEKETFQFSIGPAF